MTDVLAVRDEYRMQNWMEIIRECQASGLTNKAFCAQRGISEKTYYYWLHKIRTAATAVEPKLVPLQESVSKDDRVIHIRYGSAKLDLPECVDLDAVAAVLRSLQSHA